MRLGCRWANPGHRNVDAGPEPAGPPKVITENDFSFFISRCAGTVTTVLCMITRDNFSPSNTGCSRAMAAIVKFSRHETIRYSRSEDGSMQIYGPSQPALVSPGRGRIDESRRQAGPWRPGLFPNNDHQVSTDQGLVKQTAASGHIVTLHNSTWPLCDPHFQVAGELRQAL